MDKDEILAEIARYVDEGEYQDLQGIIDLLTAIRASILARDADAPLL
jgi:thioredoxin-related protein